MKIYVLMLSFSSLFLSGCFTVPGKDRFVYTDSFVNEDLGCIRPLSKPTERLEYIPANQSLKSKAQYINQCMINYASGHGWTNKQDFQN